MAAAILGETASYGLHLDENRKPTVVIDADIDGSIFSYSLLGQAVGMAIGSGVPYFKGISPEVEEAKTLCAAMAASGSVALYHVEGVTPEAGNFDVSDLEVIHIGEKELQAAYDKLNTVDDIQLIALGCPHLTEKEMHQIASFLKGKKKVNKDVEIWFCTSAEIRDRCPEDVKIMRSSDPCWRTPAWWSPPSREHSRGPEPIPPRPVTISPPSVPRRPCAGTSPS